MDKNISGDEIPLNNWEYYFASYGDKTVVENPYSDQWITMEEMYHVFKNRLKAETNDK